MRPSIQPKLATVTPSHATTTAAMPRASNAPCARSTARVRSCSIDYAGPTGELTDGSRAHIFVAALGASSYTYACATPRETMADWLGATAQALRFMGGAPQLIVPDNPKALIANADRYGPPARPYHPQDKGKVESAVQVVERRILMRLRQQKFATVDDVNQAIAPLLAQLNAKAFQKLPGSRASAFTQLDAPALQPLPAQT